LTASESHHSLSRRKVCPWVMRARFNALRIAEREGDGHVMLVILDDAAAPPKAGQVAGARSQFIEYREDRRPVAKCHRYLKPDRTIGGRGRPDPKWLRVENEVWTPSHFDFERCSDCP